MTNSVIVMIRFDVAHITKKLKHNLMEQMFNGKTEVIIDLTRAICFRCISCDSLVLFRRCWMHVRLGQQRDFVLSQWTEPRRGTS
jgi:hypothetical protein